jgi:DNA-binding transcriptional MerR regulator
VAEALRIGELAQATGVPAKTIRYYEQVGVLPAPSRSAGGYRQYSPRGVHRVLFIRRARALGLPLRQLKALARALDDGPRATVRPQLRALVRAQLAAVEQQTTDLELLRRQLEQVLRRLLTPRSLKKAEGCGCLEIEDGLARERRRRVIAVSGTRAP